MSFVSASSDLFIFDSWNKKTSKEQITSHRVALLALLYEFCAAYEKKELIPERFRRYVISSREMMFSDQEVKAILTLMLELYQGPEMALKDLILYVKRKIKAELFDKFLERLLDMSEDGVRSLMDFFQSFQDEFLHFSETILQKSSLFGLFARKMIVTFDMLSFGEIVNLYNRFSSDLNPYQVLMDEDIQKKRQPCLNVSLPTVQQQSNSDGVKNTLLSPEMCEDKAKRKSSGGNQPIGSYKSQKQAEYYIAHQAFLLHHNPNEAAPPTELQDKIKDILKENPNLAEAHFLSYLNNLRVKEFCTTIHNLYHYFDRYSPAGEGNQMTKSKEMMEDVNRRCAALNLAALHYSFGHKEQALAALHEAIKLAQKTNDHLCLQHALVWLHRLGDAGVAETAKLMKRQVSVPGLASLGIQSLARYSALAGMKPALIIEILLTNNMMSSQYSQGEFVSVSLAQIAAFWHIYGKRENCSLTSQLMLNLDTSDVGIYRNEESICIGLCNMARLHFGQGLVGAAMDILKSAKDQFHKHTAHAHIWMSCEQEIKFDTATNSGRWDVAEHAVLNLRAVNKQEADLRYGILLKNQGDVLKAIEHMEKLLEVCKKGEEGITPYYYCRALLVLCDLHRQTGNYSVAIFYTLRCITKAQEHHFERLVSLATMHMAHIQLLMGWPHLAVTILEQQMIGMLTHGSLIDQGCTLYCYARCLVAHGAKVGGISVRKDALLSAMNQMSLAIDHFEKAAAYRYLKDALYYQARICDQLGYIQERNMLAYKFRQLNQQYATLSQMDINLL